MDKLLFGLGAVMLVEGLVLALAPGRIVQILALIASLTPEARRLIGLAALATGAFLVTLAGMVGG